MAKLKQSKLLASHPYIVVELTVQNTILGSRIINYLLKIVAKLINYHPNRYMFCFEFGTFSCRKIHGVNKQPNCLQNYKTVKNTKTVGCVHCKKHVYRSYYAIFPFRRRPKAHNKFLGNVMYWYHHLHLKQIQRHRVNTIALRKDKL